MDEIYCFNCDTEAMWLTSNGTPLCATCAEAYQLGQAEPEVGVSDVDDEEYLEMWRQRQGGRQ